MFYSWFSHDVTKIQTTKLSILLRFYFHDVLEQLKTNFHTNFRFKRVLGFVIEYAWISKLLRDAAFTWRPRGLSCRLKKWLISGHFASFHFPDSGLYLLNGFDFYFDLFWMAWHWKPAIGACGAFTAAPKRTGSGPVIVTVISLW